MGVLLKKNVLLWNSMRLFRGGGKRIEVLMESAFSMASPSQEHQTVVLTELLVNIRAYLKKKGGDCQVFPAPFDVKLSTIPLTIVQPDILVVCDRNKLMAIGAMVLPIL